MLQRSIGWQHLLSVLDPLHSPGFTAALCWSPCGKFLAAGVADGKVCVYSVEQGSWDHRLLLSGYHSKEGGVGVSCVSWSRVPVPASPLPHFLRVRAHSFRPTLLQLPAEGTPYSYPPLDADADGGALPQDPLATDAPTFMPLLCAGDATGRVSFHLGADLPLGCVLLPGGASVTSITMSHDWGFAAVLCAPTELLPSTLYILNTSALRVSAWQLHEVADECASVSECVKHCLRAVVLMQEHWDGASKAVSGRFADFARLVVDYSDSAAGASSAAGSWGACAELAKAFTSGVPTPAVLQFFQTSFNDQIATKLFRALDTACSVLETLAVHHVIPALERAIMGLSNIRGRVAVGACSLGWTVAALTELVDHSTNGLRRVDEMRRVVSDGRQHLGSLFKWFKRLCRVGAAEAGKDPLSLTDDDRLCITRVLQVPLDCVHLSGSNWFSTMGVARFFTPTAPASATDSAPPAPAPHSPAKMCAAYIPGTACSVCDLSASGAFSLPLLLTAVEAKWSFLLASTAVAASFPVAAQCAIRSAGPASPRSPHPPSSLLVCALSPHCDVDRRWRSCTGKRVHSSLLFSVCSRDADAWSLSLFRFLAAPASCSPTVTVVESAVIVLDGVTQVSASSFYSHSLGAKSSPNTPHLSVCVSREGVEASELALYSYRDLVFRECGSIPMPCPSETGDAVTAADSCRIVDMELLTAAAAAAITAQHTSPSKRAPLPFAVASHVPVVTACSGARGLACVSSVLGHCAVFDVEDIEEEDEDDEAGEGGESASDVSGGE